MVWTDKARHSNRQLPLNHADLVTYCHCYEYWGFPILAIELKMWRTISLLFVSVQYIFGEDELSRFRRSPSPLNTQFYKIVPKIERRNIWDSSELGNIDEEIQAFWEDVNIDGDFGMRSNSKTRFKKNKFSKYKDDQYNRRKRNMKVIFYSFDRQQPL